MENMKKPVLYIIVPCYNGEEVLPITTVTFLDKLKELVNKGKIDEESRILLVDDGSTDDTWNIIVGLTQDDHHFLGMKQSRNRGHQSTLLAGLMEAKDMCDITISIDEDGQDDINAMDEMVEAYLNGSEVVYGVRSKRDTDTAFKRDTAQTYYKLLNMLGSEVIYNHADYRLVSSKVLKSFADFEEVNIYLRGMFPLVGYTSSCVYYERKERVAGESHYTMKKLIGLAIDGITSLSIKPITIIASTGFFVSFMGFVGILWAIIRHVTGHSVTGWASMICIILFLGGIQLLSLGVIGTYVGKTYMEAKHRPRYIIEKRTWENKDMN